jgi:hypothetical protein
MVLQCACLGWNSDSFVKSQKAKSYASRKQRVTKLETSFPGHFYENDNIQCTDWIGYQSSGLFPLTEDQQWHACASA